MQKTHSYTRYSSQSRISGPELFVQTSTYSMTAISTRADSCAMTETIVFFLASNPNISHNPCQRFPMMLDGTEVGDSSQFCASHSSFQMKSGIKGPLFLFPTVSNASCLHPGLLLASLFFWFSTSWPSIVGEASFAPYVSQPDFVAVDKNCIAVWFLIEISGLKTHDVTFSPMAELVPLRPTRACDCFGSVKN